MIIKWNGLLKATSDGREEWLNPGYIELRKQDKDVFEIVFAAADMGNSVTVQIDKKGIEEIADKIKEIVKSKESEY